MKGKTVLAVAALAVATMVIHDLAEARVGGGRSFGAQRPSVTPRAPAPPATAPSAAASQPVMPAQPGATLAAKPAAPAAPAASGASRWLGPIAGLAAGLGLAALLSHFGLPEGFASFLLIALLVVAGVFVLRLLFARREQPQRPLAYAGMPSPGAAPAAGAGASAPQWGGLERVEPVMGAAASAPSAGNSLPPGFDAAGFAKHAKLQFVRLQAAHDAGDRAALKGVLTPEMFAEVVRDLDSGAARAATDIVSLDAEVLDVGTEGDQHWASVRFAGTLREGAGAVPAAFDEIWNLAKPVNGKTGWLLAGIRQLA